MACDFGSIVTFLLCFEKPIRLQAHLSRMEHEQLRALLKQGSWLGPGRLRARGTLKWGELGVLAWPGITIGPQQGLHQPGWVCMGQIKVRYA